MAAGRKLISCGWPERMVEWWPDELDGTIKASRAACVVAPQELATTSSVAAWAMASQVPHPLEEFVGAQQCPAAGQIVTRRACAIRVCAHPHTCVRVRGAQTCARTHTSVRSRVCARERERERY